MTLGVRFLQILTRQGPANHLLPRQQLRECCLHRLLVGQELVTISIWVAFEMELRLYARWNHGFMQEQLRVADTSGRGHALCVPLDMGLQPQR